MNSVACPYFIPAERIAGGAWSHPARLPLGGGFAGNCIASGTAQSIADEQLHECNLGYARGCARLPVSRTWDAIRFGIALDRDGRLQVRFVCERDCRPIEHGTLEYELATNQWTNPHGDLRVQRKAECFVQSYLLKRTS
jgi:hypothetical protein